MQEKQVVEQEVKAEVREFTEPEMEKVVGGANTRMESGLRINSAKDDYAGLQISDRMTAEIKGL